MVQKELFTRLIAHNLIRCLMAQAATEHHVALDRISFKGTLDALRHFAPALARARSRKRRQKLWDQLLHTLAADLVPERPGRREPRALKRRPKPFPPLTRHRRTFQEISHKNRYWKGGPCKRRGAKYLRAN